MDYLDSSLEGMPIFEYSRSNRLYKDLKYNILGVKWGFILGGSDYSFEGTYRWSGHILDYFSPC